MHNFVTLMLAGSMRAGRQLRPSRQKSLGLLRSIPIPRVLCRHPRHTTTIAAIIITTRAWVNEYNKLTQQVTKTNKKNKKQKKKKKKPTGTLGPLPSESDHNSQIISSHLIVLVFPYERSYTHTGKGWHRSDGVLSFLHPKNR